VGFVTVNYRQWTVAAEGGSLRISPLTEPKRGRPVLVCSVSGEPDNNQKQPTNGAATTINAARS
jgi:hypothetical protein